MADLQLKNIKKEYQGGVVAVSDFNLDIADKEFVVFVGPSGCGKSTTLRMIAGLEEISGGELYIGGEYMNDISPRDRDIAMVFQNYALYPHMTVYDNMAFGLKLRKTPKDEIDRRVIEAAKILDIEHLLDRKPKALSGGQRQRVALGRAIVREPKVFLMDEPLSNLDAKLRGQMRTEIGKLHQRLQTTFIYVTHDQVEAMTMGDRIVVMKDGIIQQVATPQDLYDNPCNMFVAGFIGTPQMNFLTATVEKDGDAILFSFGSSKVKVTGEKAKKVEEYVGKEVVLGLRPEALSTDANMIANNPDCVVDAEVEITEMLGAETILYTVVGENKCTVRINSRNSTKSGDKVKLCLDVENMHIFDKDTEQIITH